MSKLVGEIGQQNAGRQSVMLFNREQRVQDLSVAQSMVSDRGRREQKADFNEPFHNHSVTKKRGDDSNDTHEFGLFGGLIRAVGLEIALQRTPPEVRTVEKDLSSAMANRPVSTSADSAANGDGVGATSTPEVRVPGSIVADRLQQLFRQQSNGSQGPAEFVGPMPAASAPSAMVGIRFPDTQEDVVTLVIEVKIAEPAESDTPSAPTQEDSLRAKVVKPENPIPK